MAIIKRDVVIDPRFPLPELVADVRVDYSESSTSSFDENDVISVAGPDGVVPQDTTLNPSIPTVTSMSIIDQTIRFTDDGRAVVDATIQFPVASEVIELQVQISKV